LIGRMVGPYRIERLLGRGGMGSVYLAERDDGDFRVRAAIKLVATGLLSPSARERFLAERQILAGLEHPNIARLFDGGITDDNTPFFVMEYVDGRPIDQYCDENGLNLRERIKLVLEVCAAVRHAHENLVIHRDLKPENVLVSTGGAVKLLDFGIARALDASGAGFHTMTAQPHPMTLAYASPEQVRGLPLTTASDVYGLGVLLYRLLTGRHPYMTPGASLADAERTICETAPTPPERALDRIPEEAPEGTRPLSSYLSPPDIASRRGTTVPRLRKELSGDLGLILLTALRKEPDRRYRGVAELSDDLLSYLDGLPVSARADTAAYRMRRFVGRHRAAVAAASVIGVLTLSLAILAAHYTLDTRAQAKRLAVEIETTEEISDFVLDLRRLADPGEGGGDTLTVRAALARGVDTQRGRLSARPELRARLLGTIAGAYTGLGLEDDAIPLLLEAVALRPETGTLADTVLGKTMVQLGLTYRVKGANADALRLFDEALGLYSRIGSDSVMVANVLAQMSMPLQRAGNADSARVVAARSLGVHRRVLGEAEPGTLRTATIYASTLWAVGELDSAIAVVRGVIEQGDALEDVPGEVMASALNNLGAYLRFKDDFAGAEESYRRALDEFGDWITLSDRQTVLVNLASTLNLQGDTAGALGVLSERLSLAHEWWPGGSWRVGAAADALGNAYMQFGDPASAEVPLREAIASYDSTIGPEHSWTAKTESILGEALGLLGRPEEAEPYLLRAHVNLSSGPRPNEAWARDAAGRLADFYERQGRQGEAMRYRALAGGSS